MAAIPGDHALAGWGGYRHGPCAGRGWRISGAALRPSARLDSAACMPCGAFLRQAAAGCAAWQVERGPAAGDVGGRRVAQGGHISPEPRINERIRVPEVRLVGPKGEQVGIVAIGDALRLAQEADLDLVEGGPTARPPGRKLRDYGKVKDESAVN